MLLKMQGWKLLLYGFGTGLKIYFHVRIAHPSSQSYSKLSC